ncbi:2-phospho-L-lactate guanylyltransferase [Microbacterium chocolatum]|uniref:2-phospho-L-lactate guanylyltransferase n=1 Tax=Microbacterium aurantiacum TaxID=162393 RepID=UPI00338D4B0F
MSDAARPARWVVVVPVKPAGEGKSRLQVDGARRTDLARAIALDTLAAVAVSPRVLQLVVVGDDPQLAREAAMLPAVRFVPDPAPGGLDRAVAAGIDAVDPRGALPRAALLGDLPALRPENLSAALDLAAGVDRGVVPDAEGTGSTLVTAAPGVPWASSFGDGSLARHVASGCRLLDLPASSPLRRDVDTIAQLRAAVALGVGRRTEAASAGLLA